MVGSTDHELSSEEYNRIKHLDPAMQMEALAKMRNSPFRLPSSPEESGAATASLPKPHKYGAKAEEYDGYTFASQKEKRRYQELVILQHAGEISDLEVHPKFQFVHKGVMIGRYTADFRYTTKEGEVIVEDTKGGRATVTEAYRLRRRLMLAFHGITIKEV